MRLSVAGRLIVISAGRNGVAGICWRSFADAAGRLLNAVSRLGLDYA